MKSALLLAAMLLLSSAALAQAPSPPMAEAQPATDWQTAFRAAQKQRNDAQVAAADNEVALFLEKQHAAVLQKDAAALAEYWKHYIAGLPTAGLPTEK